MTFAAAAETKTLSYDDRWDVSGQEVEIIDAGVHEGEEGGAVISLEDGVLRAAGVGTAAAEIDGVRGVEFKENCIERENRYDLMIVLEMDEEALPSWDASEIHHRWKDEYGHLVAKKAIFDCE